MFVPIQDRLSENLRRAPSGVTKKVHYETSDRGPTQRPGDPDVSNKKLQAK